MQKSEYRSRIQTAITEAIFTASMSEDGSTCTLLSGEITEALLSQIAFIVHTSADMDSPTKRRRNCAELGKKLARMIEAYQSANVAAGIGIETVNVTEVH